MKKNINKSCFFITHHKAGSVFCMNLLSALEPYSGLKAIDPLLANWTSEAPRKERDVLETYNFEPLGQIYMIRFYTSLLENKSINFSEITGVAMIRDPRDTLISGYFSEAYSHPKSSGQAQEEFLAQRKRLRNLGLAGWLRSSRAENLKMRQEAMLKNLGNKPNILWTTYEKMVVNFDLWFDEIIRQFQWTIPCADKTSIKDNSKKSFIVESEDINRHKRRVAPGGWKERFTPADKEYVKKVLGDTLIRLRYEKDLNW